MSLLILPPFALGQSPPPGLTPPIDYPRLMAAVRKPYGSACKSFLAASLVRLWIHYLQCGMVQLPKPRQLASL